MKVSRHISSESLPDWVLSDKNILRFLAFYRLLNYLWNPRHPMYRDTILRGRMYDAIARQMQVCLVDEHECLKFMEFLKSKYLEEKKIKKDKRPKWFLVIDRMVKDVAYPCKTPSESIFLGPIFVMILELCAFISYCMIRRVRYKYLFR
ncbi:hypothetical protein TKK_0014915 [Trichogramma kaykai]